MAKEKKRQGEEKQEISCDLWRLGPVGRSDNGGPPQGRCRFFEEGRCTNKNGPVSCPTGGMRSALV